MHCRGGGEQVFPPPGKSYPSHSQPASCCAAYSKEGMGAWPHVDGG